MAKNAFDLQLEKYLSTKSCSYNTEAISPQMLPNSLMPPELADKFIDLSVNLSTLLPRVRTIKTNVCSGKIPKLDLVGPVSQGRSAASCPTGFTPEERTLFYEMIGYRSYIPLEDDFLRCNLEGAGFESTLMEMWKKAMANDAEYAAIQGDESLTVGDGQSALNNLLGVNDGWLKKICACIPECNVVDAAGASPSRDLYYEAKRRIPVRFRGIMDSYRLIGSHAVADQWGYFWGGRETAQGDAVLATGDVPGPWGLRFLPVALWPDMIPYGTTGDPVSHIVLTPPQNLIYMASRNIRMEKQRDAKCGVDEFIMNWEADFLVNDINQVVLITNVSACGTAYSGCSTCGPVDDLNPASNCG
jgi:hypothetical protein